MTEDENADVPEAGAISQSETLRYDLHRLENSVQEVHVEPVPLVDVSSEPKKQIVESIDIIPIPYYVPSRESLARILVPLDYVKDLEEARSDEMRWEAVMWAFIGAILGVVTNWVTSDPLVISKSSIIILAVFGLMAILSWNSNRIYKKRVLVLRNSLEEFSRNTLPSRQP